METPFGELEIELFAEQTPQTVANFLTYVNSGAYADSFIHRSVRDFIIQGGGFTWENDTTVAIPTNPPVINEPGILNTRGTIAMAKLGGDPNSATSQWFINVEDNPSLDSSNGGFTVFGRVIGDGMAIVDQINNLQIWNAGSPFGEIPLIDYPGQGNIMTEHLVLIDINQVMAPGIPINAGFNDAWRNPVKKGGQGFFIVIYPVQKSIYLSWFTYDLSQPDAEENFVVGAPGQRWYTAFGSYDGDTAELELELTRTGIFDSDTVPVQSTAGTVTLKAISCTEMLLIYDIFAADVTGEIPLERISDDNVERCELLNEQE
jgi:cyclophilin family peptidyl-prolyl cis-trans isomerase